MEKNYLQDLLAKHLEKVGYKLSSFSFCNEMGEKIVRIIVDRPKPIDMKAIEEVTNYISAYFDELDPIDGEYLLDISSLGAEKPISICDLGEYIGCYINVNLKNPVEGDNIVEGELVNVLEDEVFIEIRIKTRKKIIKTTLANIAKARLAVKI